jgi:hypothetical protein
VLCRAWKFSGGKFFVWYLVLTTNFLLMAVSAAEELTVGDRCASLKAACFSRVRAVERVVEWEHQRAARAR